jgi:hypothetical protein
MLYLDYNFDLNNDSIMFDPDMRLEGHELPAVGGRLPAKWKEGDLWMMKTAENGRVILYRKPD